MMKDHTLEANCQPQVRLQAEARPVQDFWAVLSVTYHTVRRRQPQNIGGHFTLSRACGRA